MPSDQTFVSNHGSTGLVDLPSRRILVSRLAASAQEQDLTLPTNCGGFGRVHHFRLFRDPSWGPNPLPIVPACRRLGISAIPAVMTAQVFQNAACNWRCWYCYVPYDLLSADRKRAAWLGPEELVSLYADAQPQRPLILDLSGGSPDLVPEWVPWIMDALTKAGLAEDSYLWSDDNLSTPYLFDYLAKSDIDRIVTYRNYGRVGCFKGFDEDSFRFNTGAPASDFVRQFKIMAQLLQLGVDVYGYVTFTAETDNDLVRKMRRFVDRLQELDPNLPLRTVPLKVSMFSPVRSRMNVSRERALSIQETGVVAWNEELAARYPQQPFEFTVDAPLNRRFSG